MALEIYLYGNGGRGSSYGIVGAVTTITIRNVPVCVGDIIEFTYKKDRIQGLIVIDPYSNKPIVWGWASMSDKLLSNPFDLKLIPNVSNIRAGQQISYRIYAREYNEPNIM
jgi:hypothetical protein